MPLIRDEKSTREACHACAGARCETGHDCRAGGLVVFSFTGPAGQHLLTEHPGLVSAAVISDGVWGGYASNIVVPDHPRNPAPEFHPPDFENIGEFFRRNPAYSITQSRTPIRLEAIGELSALAHWEYYLILRQAKHPVDLAWFPVGIHTLVKPAELLASQGGTVDWMRFWLQGEEDSDQAKAQRYRRWRKMKEDWQRVQRPGR